MDKVIRYGQENTTYKVKSKQIYTCRLAFSALFFLVLVQSSVEEQKRPFSRTPSFHWKFSSKTRGNLKKTRFYQFNGKRAEQVT